ncbi:ribosomal protein L24E [Candidatus Methanoperedens nitroreducens]|uniref:Large ribosomal subunit protein eL24 n=1 Tax=Candidatus Methanoperedens nitratireducens TaxID=1392998 RepID=A0A062V807_9EURY|nr:50S ribosomal protein L24e [Candidatus Methanoperedens nitroreducens]KCZ71894.1 ribosomal protein L24E [Candidatus Methanoperedens nitroreducens]MDJ1422133.1 50S ribosomal protein L24e [Candidatus Methanoperedens sp.]
MEKRKCSFCGVAIEQGTGKLYARKDGTVFYFCSSKCQRNLNLGRIPRKVRWTEAGRKARGKAAK